jgi:hypothetical protein
MTPCLPLELTEDALLLFLVKLSCQPLTPSLRHIITLGIKDSYPHDRYSLATFSVARFIDQ